MPSVRKEDLQRWGRFAAGELVVARDTMRERGWKFFLRPLAMSGAAVFAAHHFLYSPPVARAGRVASELAAAKATSQYAEDYQNLQARLGGLYSRLPRTSDPQGWLLSEVRKTLREEGLVPLSISPPTESLKGEYLFVSIKVRCQAGYSQAASWISRLERAGSILFVQDLVLKKDQDPIGSNTLDVTVTTVVPSGSGGQ